MDNVPRWIYNVFAGKSKSWCYAFCIRFKNMTDSIWADPLSVQSMKDTQQKGYPGGLLKNNTAAARKDPDGVQHPASGHLDI